MRLVVSTFCCVVCLCILCCVLGQELPSSRCVFNSNKKKKSFKGIRSRYQTIETLRLPRQIKGGDLNAGDSDLLRIVLFFRCRYALGTNLKRHRRLLTLSHVRTSAPILALSIYVCPKPVLVNDRVCLPRQRNSSLVRTVVVPT